MKYQTEHQWQASSKKVVATSLTPVSDSLVYQTALKASLCLITLMLILTSCDLSELEEAVEGFTEQPSFETIPVQYPKSTRDSSVHMDQYFGYQIADPYRWLEQDTARQVLEWEEMQNQTTTAYLDKIPFRQEIQEQLQALGQYYRRGTPSYHGSHYYLLYNSGEQQHDALARVDELTDSVTIVLDPNSWPAGSSYALGRYAFSDDGRYLAYEQRSQYTGESLLKIVDVLERTAFSDELKVQGLTTLTWHEDGFYYTTFPPGPNNVPQLFHRLYYHQLGTTQLDDELVFADYGQPEGRITAFADTMSQSLVLQVQGNGIGNAVYFRALNSTDPSFIPITDDSKYRFSWAGGTATHLYFVTDYQADRGRLIKVSTQAPERAYWEEVIGETSDVLNEVSQLAGHWTTHYWRDGTSQVILFNQDFSTSRRLHLPEPGTLTGLAEGKGRELFFGFTSYVRPETVYRLDLDNYRSGLLYAPHPPFDPDNYQLKRQWIDAYDSTPIPVTILSRKDISLDQPHLTLLIAAGAKHEPLVPRWNLTGHMLVPAILEQGGVVVIANVRGSKGFGRRWRASGSLTKKQQSLDDLQAVAEFLREQPFVDPSKLAAYGAGAGATLLGATLNQRPDLFTVVIGESGWYDLLRYDRFNESTEAQAFYGSSQDSLYNDHLLSYSPLHNALPNKFPATLLLNEPMIAAGVPLHSRKLAAELQYQQRANTPVLWYSPVLEAQGTVSTSNSAAILSFLFYQTQTAW